VAADQARLFVALSLPETVIDELVRWRTPVLASIDGLREVSAGSLHVTLCFLGSRPRDEVDRIADACEVVGAMAPPALSLSDPAWLSTRRPKVLAVRLHDPDRGLEKIQSALSRTLARGGWYEPEARPFLAHVTVARAGRRERVRPVGLAPPAPVAWRGRTVVLFRSRLDGRGAQYEALRTVELRMSTGAASVAPGLQPRSPEGA
jgi:RNA 2',3'-cyclic 3'-phosphodiesterase